MKVIIACTAVTGHINPMLSIVRILVGNGHDVVALTASAFRSHFTRIGAQFRSLPAAIDHDLSDADANFPERKNLTPGSERLLFDFTQVFIESMTPQHQALRDILRDFPADLILCDDFFFGTFPMLLGPRADRPTIVHCGTTCLFTSRDDGAPFGPGLPPATTETQMREYERIQARIAGELLDPVQRVIDRKLAALGCDPLPVPVLDAIPTLADLYLHPTVPGFEYPRRALPSTVRFIGALPQPKKQAPLPDWTGDLDGTRRLVLVTQGTVSNYDFSQLVEPTLAALADRPDVLALVTTGGRTPDALRYPLPDNARVAQFLPFEWLMPRLDLLVTNGGYGTVTQALCAGIPIVAAGRSEDKAEVAAHIAWSGAGINLETDRPSLAALRTAIDTVLDGGPQRAAAQSLSREFARYDAEAEVLRLLHATVVSADAATDPNPRHLVPAGRADASAAGFASAAGRP